ncbi:MAG: hypothetical protein K2H41_03560 [Acetatifactor sp.]|nr:hypothetical protein [Acetatifactor sp.]
MKYFKKELWYQMHDSNKSIRLNAEREWNENVELYSKKFEEVEKQLPRRFVKEYLKRHGMHDYGILGLHIVKKGKTYSCEMQLTDGTETVLITMLGLEAVRVDVDSFQYCILGRLEWAYSEFDITPENNISLSILCDFQNEMQFEFKSITLVKLYP